MVFLGKTTDYVLHIGATEDTLKTAKRLRKNMTEPEKILWNELKNRKLKRLKFRRQHPLLFYIADFYCHGQRLVIEIDGGVPPSTPPPAGGANSIDLYLHGARCRSHSP